MSGTLAGNGTADGTERWTDCCSVGGGGEERTGVTDCAGDVGVRRDRLHWSWSTGREGLAQGEGGRTAEGVEWREEGEEGGRRAEERGESTQSCGC